MLAVSRKLLPPGFVRSIPRHLSWMLLQRIHSLHTRSPLLEALMYKIPRKPLLSSQLTKMVSCLLIWSSTSSSELEESPLRCSSLCQPLNKLPQFNGHAHIQPQRCLHPIYRPHVFRLWPPTRLDPVLRINPSLGFTTLQRRTAGSAFSIVTPMSSISSVLTPQLIYIMIHWLQMLVHL